MALILHESEIWLLRVLDAAGGTGISDAGMIQQAAKHRPDLSREAVRAARAKHIKHHLAALEDDMYVITEDGKKELKKLTR